MITWFVINFRVDKCNKISPETRETKLVLDTSEIRHLLDQGKRNMSTTQARN